MRKGFSVLRSLYRHIPNLLTLLRLILVPIILTLILKNYFHEAFVLFAIASITDFLDGYLARRWNVVTKLGRIIDPVADKTLMMGCYLVLGYLQSLPLWLVVLVVGRDVLILFAGLVTYLLNLSVVFKPSFMSKINTFSQILLAGMVLLTNYSYGYPSPIPGLDFLMILLLMVMTFLTVWSGTEYALYFLQKTLYSKEKKFL